MIIVWIILSIIGVLTIWGLVNYSTYKRAMKGVDEKIDLGAPMKGLREVMDNDTDKEHYRLLGFIDKNGKKNTRGQLKIINEAWVERFIQTCHWAGYQIILTKEGEEDIEVET